MLSDAELRPPCAYGVGAGYRAKRLTRERLGVGNRCFEMLRIEAKVSAKQALVRFGGVRRYAPGRPEPAHNFSCRAGRGSDPTYLRVCATLR
jgi:hypothetical protein